MSELKYLFDNKMNEECGVFAVFNHERAAELTFYGLHALQHRGQEAAGIASTDGKNIFGYKEEGLVKKVFTEDKLRSLKGTNAIGHVRYATAGGKGVKNAQPFTFETTDTFLGLAHNGNLVNAKSLRKELEDKGTLFQTSSDSEIVAHLIKRAKGTFGEKLKEALPRLEGSFAFLMLKENALYLARDKNGLRPLSIGKIGNSIVVTSETCAFNVTGAKHLRDVLPGEIVKITKESIQSDFYTEEITNNICSMEYVYFARPDSDIEGINVHTSRRNAGRVLARESKVDADIVIGVPDSGLSAAQGYSDESGIPLEMGLIKNKYSGRTFIEPSQELRELGVKMKLSPVPSLVKDKKVVIIDDSIVRGTTSKKLVAMLKEAGAKEVHFRVSSPELKHPCFYGVDFSTYDELISSRKSVDEVCKEIKADSLAFISLEGLQESIGRGKSKGKYCGQCVACFNGDYTTDLHDEKENIKKV